MVEASSLCSNNGAVKNENAVKFLCSYGGMILPRPTDGKLRYFGGETRVLSVDRSITYSELMVKMAELCGSSVILRCQLPNEDLDALVSITSDEDLANLIEEYDRASKTASVSLKIRAFLSPPKSLKKISPPSSAASSAAVRSNRLIHQATVDNRCVHQIGFPPVCVDRSAGSKPPRYYACSPHLPQRNPNHIYFLHKGNHWQEP